MENGEWVKGERGKRKMVKWKEVRGKKEKRKCGCGKWRRGSAH